MKAKLFSQKFDSNEILKVNSNHIRKMKFLKSWSHTKIHITIIIYIVNYNINQFLGIKRSIVNIFGQLISLID